MDEQRKILEMNKRLRPQAKKTYWTVYRISHHRESEGLWPVPFSGKGTYATSVAFPGSKELGASTQKSWETSWHSQRMPFGDGVNQGTSTEGLLPGSSLRKISLYD